jgi:hypothetical protein
VTLTLDEGTPTIVVTDGISRIFFYTSTSDIGSYEITFHLSDGVNSPSFSFILDVLSSEIAPPILVPSSIATQVVGVGRIGTLNLTEIITDPQGLPLTFTDAGQSLPFVNLTSAIYTFRPTFSEAPNTYALSFEASNGHNTSAFSFDLMINNNAPTLS